MNETLEKIGLTKGESKVYLALLELGSSTTGLIIENSGISSSKVYQILDRLVHKGLVSHVVRKGVRVYVAQDPNKLMDFLREKKKNINDNISSIQSILPQLALLKVHGAKGPIAQVFEGKRGYIQAHDILVSEMREGTKYYTMTIGPASKIFTEYFDEFNKTRIQKKVDMCIIYRNDAWPRNKEKQTERVKRKFYYPRISPKGYFIPVQITLQNDVCLLSIFGDDILSILIRNKTMVKGFMNYFAYVWSISKTPKGYLVTSLSLPS